MRNINILEDELFQLPKTYNNEYFLKYTEKNFEEFVKKLDNFNGYTAENIDKVKIKELCNAIQKCLEYYFEGRIIIAYNSLVKGLDSINDKLLYLKKERHTIPPSKYNLYRARSSEYILTREEMFHPPFQMRDALKDQRFSIRGLPCLYLSNCSYLCWEELGRPNLDTFQVARVELDEEKLRLLDLTFSVNYLKGFYKNFKHLEGMNPEQFIPYYLYTWPLRFITSLRVAHLDSFFKPEYIVSQLLLEWVRSNLKLDGIKYLTTKKILMTSSSSGFINYAIPVTTSKEKNYCENLSKKIKLTEPISKKTIEILQFNLNKKDYISSNSIDISFYPASYGLDEVEINSEQKQIYFKTIFGEIEAHLAKFEAKQISAN